MRQNGGIEFHPLINGLQLHCKHVVEDIIIFGLSELP